MILKIVFLILFFLIPTTAAQSYGNSSYGSCLYGNTIPAFSIESPQATTYETLTIQLDVISNECTTPDSWWYQYNGGTNITFIPNTTLTAGGGNGQKNLIVWMNDTAGEEISQNVSFTLNVPVSSSTPSSGGGGSSSAIGFAPQLETVPGTFNLPITIQNTNAFKNENITLSVENCPPNWLCETLVISPIATDVSTLLSVTTPSTEQPGTHTLIVTAENTFSTLKQTFKVKIIPVCTADNQCSQDERCRNFRCVRLFDIKVLRADTPIAPGEFLDFSYFLKDVSDVSDDVDISYWLEDSQGQRVVSGSEVIYVESREEKKEQSIMFIPSTVEEGLYMLHVQLRYGTYSVISEYQLEVSKNAPTLLTLDIELPKNKSMQFHFNTSVAFNKDIPVRLQLSSSIINSQEIVWEKERSLDVNRSLELIDHLFLEEGDYKLQVIGTYENRTSVITESFSITSYNQLDIIPLFIGTLAFMIVLILFLAVRFGKIEHVKYILTSSQAL